MELMAREPTTNTHTSHEVLYDEGKYNSSNSNHYDSIQDIQRKDFFGANFNCLHILADSI